MGTPVQTATMGTKRLVVAERVSAVRNSRKGRSFVENVLKEDRENALHLKLFFRHLCSQCSETEVAEEIRHLHHVQRVQPHPERHEIEIWAGFPAEGLLREIIGVARRFCCEVAASHVR